MRYQGADSRGPRGIERSKAMMGFSRVSGLAFGLLALFFVNAAGAQENLDHGKTPAQLFAANCTVCHKKPQGLAKPGASGLDAFLRQHYTASRETAAALAGYLQSVGSGPAGAKGAKTGDNKTGDNKTGDNKTVEKKPAAGKTGGPKSG